MITNKQKRRAYHLNSEYKRLTALYKLIEKFFDILQTLDEESLFSLHKEFRSPDAPAVGPTELGGQLRKIYWAIKR